jgi:hypothetical protein
MRRVLTLTQFLLRDLFGSLAGVVPLAAALAFGLIAFEYGMDQAQFMTVSGVATGLLCLLTTLLLANRASRASLYLLLARLHRRVELLAALLLGGLVVTTVLTFLIAMPNLAVGRLTLDFPSALWVVPTWLPLWLMMAALALCLSGLVERSGSHLVGYILVVALLVANDRQPFLEEHGLKRLVQLVNAVLWPVDTALSRASAGVHERSYYLALGLLLVYAVLFFGLAAQLFVDKDLLWAE